MTVREASRADLPQLAELMDAYRVFYGADSDVEKARVFMHERLIKQDSVIFVIQNDHALLGFTQLYPSFSSVSLRPLYILNDLFVTPGKRGTGLGEALLRHAQGFCREKGAKGLALETATDNPAQKLYERLGWKKDAGVFHYFWTS
ncbi:GNAT family N-acetyltransferase [Robiginitalea aurantiaca]|uniref:GNAT family N-acetyltransferase n=1 Tax=Robiginitalea aurantiaca TaxID=3056915 RepID=A0ABT7WGJ3_9FLAO|nr:GNAT family N-acetyltransferase [Robiginitalea aurantiaca]MDM9631973.1 GNAT family N-acetyltransferase [Robiginitalea aurantiaca]